ncbi:hypothetical protein EDD11_000982 [Mortierella claussenii]|nr:hypothetical protein EDD11_000982 [Mortierella claussenii]
MASNASQQPGASDLERQPLLTNTGPSNSGAQARSHIPSGLGRQHVTPAEQRQRDSIQRCWKVGVFAIILALLGFLAMGIYDLFTSHVGNSPFKHLDGSCDHVEPISPGEFEERQLNLSRVLVDLKATAYVAEPGANMKYFTSIRWSRSERPFLLVVQAKRDKTDQVLTKATIVSPAFEASRARQSLLPKSSITIKTWEEGESAYKVVREILDTPWAGPDDVQEDANSDQLKPKSDQHVFIDPDMRQFVAHSLEEELESSSRKVSIADKAVGLLRMTKTSHEIEILRCVSQTTVNVIRAVKDQIRVGMHESQVQDLLTEAYEEAGLEYERGGSLVLFGKNAALPHGSGNDTKLEKGMMVLIDSGAQLHGYLSDITRTFWVKRGLNKEMNDELDKVWEIVKHAQSASLDATRPGVACNLIDKAARTLIDDAGYGMRFTHRLGHGLGMEGHEEPYLNSGNTKTELRPGMVFTNEPGIYVEGQYGIRLEDVVLVTETGYEILSGELAKSAKEP